MGILRLRRHHVGLQGWKNVNNWWSKCLSVCKGGVCTNLSHQEKGAVAFWVYSSFSPLLLRSFHPQIVLKLEIALHLPILVEHCMPSPGSTYF